MLQQLKAWCHHSLTIGWGYLKIFLGVLFLAYHEIFELVADTLRDTDVKQALAAMNFPAWGCLALAIIGVITIRTRMRTVDKATDENNQIVSLQSN